MSGAARFALWMVFGLCMAPVLFFTVFGTGAMLVVGLWDPNIPWYIKAATPVGLVVLWFEFWVTAKVLDFLA